uniref:Uncharacterized protein n=1 Tax=Arundo donax TaxID=35708 RepID=A0A0A9E9L1_ARUDO
MLCIKIDHVNGQLSFHAIFLVLYLLPFACLY